VSELVRTSPLELAVIEGDLSTLSPQQRLDYYGRVCQSLGLNPYTKPFDYIRLNNKLVLYAKRDCTDQLRNIHKVSIIQLEQARHEDVWVVTAHAKTDDGRTDTSTGAVAIANLRGEALANALMKAETKAKRRVTLSICGLGMLDESEASSIHDARPVVVDEKTGEILREAPESAPAADDACICKNRPEGKPHTRSCPQWTAPGARQEAPKSDTPKDAPRTAADVTGDLPPRNGFLVAYERAGGDPADYVAQYRHINWILASSGMPTKDLGLHDMGPDDAMTACRQFIGGLPANEFVAATEWLVSNGRLPDLSVDPAQSDLFGGEA